MNPKTHMQSLLARLIEGVNVSKSILQTGMLMYKPDDIVNKIEDRYKKLNDILKLDLAHNGFLDKTDIIDRIIKLGVFLPHIEAMVSIINIGLATFKLFSETELDQVLKSLFTVIVPVNTDITQSITIAYTQLLHKVAFRRGMTFTQDIIALLEELKCTQLNWMRKYNTELTKCENNYLNKLVDGNTPMEQGEFTMLWECALNSMVRQSRIIRNVLLQMPEEIIEASKQPNATEPETTIRESISENNEPYARYSSIYDDVSSEDDVEVDHITDTADNVGGDGGNDDSDNRGIDNLDIVDIVITADDDDVVDNVDYNVNTANGDDDATDTADNAVGGVYAFQDDVLYGDDSDSNDILYDTSDNADINMAKDEVTPNDAQPETPMPQPEESQTSFPNISTSPSLPPEKRRLGSIDDESDSASDNSILAKEAKVMEDTVPPDDVEIDEPTVSDSINNQQTPQPSSIHNQEPEAPTIFPAHSPARAVEEYMESGLPNPYISNRIRYKTSCFEPGSYTRRRMQRRF